MTSILPESARNPRYGTGLYRRRIRLTSTDRCVLGGFAAWVNDVLAARHGGFVAFNG